MCYTPCKAPIAFFFIILSDFVMLLICWSSTLTSEWISTLYFFDVWPFLPHPFSCNHLCSWSQKTLAFWSTMWFRSQCFYTQPSQSSAWLATRLAVQHLFLWRQISILIHRCITANSCLTLSYLTNPESCFIVHGPGDFLQIADRPDWGFLLRKHHKTWKHIVEREINKDFMCPRVSSGWVAKLQVCVSNKQHVCFQLELC